MKIRWQYLNLPVLFGALLSPMHAATPVSSAQADRIVILKSRRQLQLWQAATLLKTYQVSLGPNPVGHKQQEGDGRTPEGIYSIVGRNPKSAYHLALRISYPNQQDRANAASRGVSPGGDIMIHGLPNGWGWVGRGHLRRDWTAGCIAVTNAEIEEIWRLVPNGATVEIRP